MQGDVWCQGFISGHEVYCRRAQLFCKGIKVCEFFDHTRLEDCERYDVDTAEMQSLWGDYLDAEEKEGSSPWSGLAR
jgi:hypothetical protein